MKKVISVSLGSDKRNHQVEIELLGEKLSVQRVGTNGDMKKAISLIKELDGKVSAFGMGGIDLYIYAGNKRYTLKEAEKLASAAKLTPIVDGSGLKNTLEPSVIKYLQQENIVDFKGKNVLVVSGVDRFGMAEAIDQVGGKVTFGDLIFGLGIPMPVKSMALFQQLARIIIPVISRMPFKYLYPTGDKQENQLNKFAVYYEEAQIIAGDFHFIRRYMPANLKDKIIITNTVTESDIELVAKTQVAQLITTTPELQGRSFGTNVMEGILVSLLEKPLAEITKADYENLISSMDLKPRVINFKNKEIKRSNIKI